MSTSPLLTILIPARNDNFMENFRYRLETTLNFAAKNAHELGLENEIEVLVTDWGSEVPLWQVLALTPQAKKITRFIIVPPAVAVATQADSEFPIVLAQNAAIRRARGEFIMQTDSDVLITKDYLTRMFHVLRLPAGADGDVKKLFIYAQRRHIPWSVVSKSPSAEELESYAVTHHNEMVIDSNPDFPWCATGMMGMHRDLWAECTGYDETLIHWGWMEIDLGLRLTTRYSYLNLTNAAAMTIYHMEHYKGSDGSTSSGRVVTRKMNPNIKNNHYAPNADSWGLAAYQLEIYAYPQENSARTPTELDNIIAPEIKNDKLYHTITNLVSQRKLSTVLEIGSSSGGGSTEAFVRGLALNPNAPKLYCMEISTARFNKLKETYASYSFVNCYNVSSVPAESFPSDAEVTKFYTAHPTALNAYPLERVLGWLHQDIDYVKNSGVPTQGIALIKQQNKIERFDAVLIDGSEFSGKAELDAVYGADLILLDDVNAFKNFENYQRLKSDPAYRLIEEDWSLRNGYAIFERRANSMPLHFFTIVLNGEPFLRWHIEMLKELPFNWHWHIIEGVAELNHDTGWSKASGGHIASSLHRNGLSNDGTTEYLDALRQLYPNQVSVYRKEDGAFWDGKLEMVSAPLPFIKEDCILFQLDSDEIWTSQQIAKIRELFLANPNASSAYFIAHYFVGPDKVISSLNTYGNHLEYEWLRAWRFTPGCVWKSHEPPTLCRPRANGEYQDLGKSAPIWQDQTSKEGLFFQHYAYVTPAQLRFKEHYYGYKDALSKWQKLQSCQSTSAIKLKEFFSWVTDEAQVESAAKLGITPLAYLDSAGKWRFRKEKESAPLLFIRSDSIGDAVLAGGMFPALALLYPDKPIIVVCQDRIADLYRSYPYVSQVVAFNRQQMLQDEHYRTSFAQGLQQIGADLSLSTVYSRDPLQDFLTIMSNTAKRIALSGDLSNITQELKAQHDPFFTQIIHCSSDPKPELERHAEFIRAMGAPSTYAVTPLITLDQQSRIYAEQFLATNGLKEKNFVAFFPFAQYEIKHYEKFDQVLSDLCQQRSLELVAFGSAAEREKIQALLSKFKGRWINAAGLTSLPQMAAITERARIAVGVDTAGIHVANALGVPQVVVLGGGHFGRFLPYSPLTSAAILPLGCYNCNWRCNQAVPFCIRSVAPSVVREAIEQSLDKKTTTARIFYQNAAPSEVAASSTRWSAPQLPAALSNVELIPVQANQIQSSTQAPVQIGATNFLL